MLFPTFRLWGRRIIAARVVSQAGLRNFKRLQGATRRVAIATFILLGVWVVFGVAQFIWSLWYVGIDAPSKFQPTPLYYVFSGVVSGFGWLMLISFIVTGILHAVLLTRYGVVMTKWQRIRAAILTILTFIVVAYSALSLIIALVVTTTK